MCWDSHGRNCPAEKEHEYRKQETLPQVKFQWYSLKICNYIMKHACLEIILPAELCHSMVFTCDWGHAHVHELGTEMHL